MKLLRPYGLILDGHLELGWEVLLQDGRIAEVRPHTGLPESYVLSPAFVNAHSHLEYRGLQDRVPGETYGEWIRELTRLKAAQDLGEVRDDCLLAAEENARTGVARIAEHSDRPFAGRALRAAGLTGVIFQEVITFFESADPGPKLAEIERRATLNRADAPSGVPVRLSPHASYTVDPATLAALGRAGDPISLHLAETEAENALFREGQGPLADFYRGHGIPYHPSGRSATQTMADLGVLHAKTQLIHACAVDERDLETIAQTGCGVAHCPRSNLRLGCPDAPIRRMLDLGIPVGLGMDSPASGGPIDFFAEMRAALEAAERRREPLSPEHVWHMGTTLGARSFHPHAPDWRIEPGSAVPLIAIEVPDALTTEALLDRAEPGRVRRIAS